LIVYCVLLASLFVAAEFKLKKPAAFHYDFLVLGLIMLMTGLLGIPPTNGLIPQAPLHTKSLVVVKYLNVEEERTPVVMGALEQRWSNFMQAFLTGLMCFPPFLGLLGLVPISALSGLFLFMGVASFIGNQFAQRMTLLVTQKKLRRCTDDYFVHCSLEDIQRFTGIQLVVCLCIFGITFTPARMVFPLLIGVLVPFRLFYMPKWFGPDALRYLDPLKDETMTLVHVLTEEERSEGGEDILKRMAEADESLEEVLQERGAASYAVAAGEVPGEGELPDVLTHKEVELTVV